MNIRRAMRLSLLFILIGFIGGAVRYWRWSPSHTTPYFIVSGILCPLCPNVDGAGTNWEKFVSRAVLGGLLSIVPALLVGWLVIGLLVAGYRQILKLRLLPKFGKCALDGIARDEVKQFLANLAGEGLSRNTLRNTLCTIRVILNQAIEDDLIDKNPASRLGRFTKSDKPKFQATPLTREECNRFLESTAQICPDYHALFLTALRAGLRRGEVVALQ